MPKLSHILIILILLGLLFVFPASYFGGTIHTVELGEEGFSPKELEIQKGDSVKFATSRGGFFWPASNIHPEHLIYPEFDPKKPIAAGESWTFRFQKTGEWKYHDHLYPIFTGTIRVKDGERAPEAPPSSNCKKGDEICWENLIGKALKKEGLDSAFSVVSELYASDPSFSGRCHWFAHKLGEKAYDIFSQDRDLNLSFKTSHCGYGFFHGFMEAMFYKGGDYELARKFCAYFGEKLKGQTGDAEGACYHGIGHGVVDGADSALWGDAQAIIRPGLELCEKVSDTQTHLNRCASGVFNSLAIMYGEPKYRLPLDKENPYKICSAESADAIRRPCYEEMNTLVLRLGNNDLEASARLVEKIPEDSYADSAIQSLAGYTASFYKNPDDFEDIISACRSLEARLRLGCIKGFAAGLVEFGAPGKEYENSLKFCSLSILTGPERDACFPRIIYYFRVLYPAEKLKELCRTAVEPAYQKFCE